MRFASNGFGRFALAGVALSLAAGHAQSELLIGLTSSNALISFDSATPGTTSAPVAVTGLTAGDALVGIDRRPQAGPNDGVLYGVGVNLGGGGRIYSINTATGAAVLASTLSADAADTVAPFPFTTVSGTSFGVDFNPTVDRLRVVSNTGQNLRINVDTGAVQLDVPLAYVSGDPAFGTSPVIRAVAYSNNFGGATTTVLRGVDNGKSPDSLVVFANPNGGTLMTALALPFDAGNVDYDISGLTGTPYFAADGMLYAAGAGGIALVGRIGASQLSLVGLAAPVGVVPEPESIALAALGLGVLLALSRRRRQSKAS